MAKRNKPEPPMQNPPAVIPKSKPLTDKEERFVQLYTTNGFNAAKATMDAGYAEPTIAFRLLRKSKIQLAIRELMEPALRAAGVSREKLIMTLQETIDGKITDVVDIKDGDIILKDGLGDKSHLVKRIAFRKGIQGDHQVALEFHDKLKAIELLLKALGADTKQVNVKFGPDADAFAAYEESKRRLANDELDRNIIDVDVEIKEDKK